MMRPDGEWLVPPGDYQDLVKGLCQSDPRLRQPDPKLAPLNILWQNRSVKIILLEYQNKKSDEAPVEPTKHVFTDVEILQAYLESLSNDDLNRVYILEGMNRSLAGLIGSHLAINPAMFVEYERIGHRSSQAPLVVYPTSLASNWAPRSYAELRYRELITLPDKVLGRFDLRCTKTGRLISVTRVDGGWDSLGMLKRKCLYWGGSRPGGRYWDAVVLCDPHPHAVKVLDSGPMCGLNFNLQQENRICGFVDFAPEQSQAKFRRGPPRTSFSDDLCFYLTTHYGQLNTENHESVFFFVKKLIATQHDALFFYLHNQVQRAQSSMRRHPDFTSLDLSSLETNWTDAQTLERRVKQSWQDLEDTLVQLRIPFDPPDPSQITSWKDVNADFRLLYHRFKLAHQWAENINSSITGLASIAGSRQSFREQQLSLRAAERARDLTFIALVFIPLAFISSLFSMSEPYGPGGERFWVYFAIAVPVAALVVAVYYLADWLGEKTRVDSAWGQKNWWKGLSLSQDRLGGVLAT